MIKSVPPTTSHKPGVTLGVSVACLVYAASLPMQRMFPGLKDVLTLSLSEGVKPTYYLRVTVSLSLGATAAMLAPRRPQPEAWMAWEAAVAVAVSVLLICAFP
jgi:hypothetical protein